MCASVPAAATANPDACPLAPLHPRQVIADFANGEISQAGSLFDTGLTLESYLDKSFYKARGAWLLVCV